MNQRLLIVTPERRPADMQKVAPGIYAVSNRCTFTNALRGTKWHTVILVNMTESELQQDNPELYEVIQNGLSTDNGKFVSV